MSSMLFLIQSLSSSSLVESSQETYFFLRLHHVQWHLDSVCFLLILTTKPISSVDDSVFITCKEKTIATITAITQMPDAH